MRFSERYRPVHQNNSGKLCSVNRKHNFRSPFMTAGMLALSLIKQLFHGFTMKMTLPAGMKTRSILPEIDNGRHSRFLSL